MWSVPMLRKAATSRPSPSTRSYLSAWLDTSITMRERPLPAALARWRQRSGDSGVVLTLSMRSTPSNVSMEPRRAVLEAGSAPPSAAASRIERSMYAVDDLPLVPVRPMTSSRSSGEARHLRMGGRQLVGQALLGEVRHAPGLEREVEVVGLERGALAHEDVTGRGLARVAVAAADGRVARAVEARRAHEEPLALKQGADLVQCDIHVAQYTGPARRRAPGAVPPRYEQAPSRRRGAACAPPRGYDGRTVSPSPRRPSWREEHGFAS